jgi:TetR/AcrR family transcriptional regulator
MRRLKSERARGRPRKKDGGIGPELILEATARLLRTMRPETVTQDHIAAAAGVNSRLIRYYFGTLDHLLTEVVLKLVKEQSERMAAASAAGRPARERIRDRMMTLLSFQTENPAFFWMLVERIYHESGRKARDTRTSFNQTSYARLAQVIEAGQRDGELRSDFDPRFLYLASIGLTEIFVTGQPILKVLFPEENTLELSKQYAEFIFELVISRIGQAAPTQSRAARTDSKLQELKAPATDIRE